MNNFLIKSFRGGISDYDDKGIPGSYKFGSGLDIRKKRDSLSCQQTLVEESPGVITDLIRFIVPASDGNAYGFGNTGKIYQRVLGGTWTLVYTDPYGEIKGATEWYLSTGKIYLFWATDTRLNEKEIGVAGWADVNTLAGYPKTNLTSADYHTMQPAVGSLQICNKDYLAMVGWDGSYTNAGLKLIRNYAKTMIERNRYVIVGASGRTDSMESGLFLWDTISTSWNDKKRFQGGIINAMIDTDIPLMQVGINGEVYYGDMTSIMPIFMIDGGGYCNPGGVENDSGVALFGIYGNTIQNGIYGYGHKIKNAPFSLNLEYPITCDEIGAIKKVGTYIVVTDRTGTTYTAKRFDATTKAIGTYCSLDLKAPEKLNYYPIWGPIVLTTAPLPAGCSIACYYKLDKGASWIQAKMEGNITTFTTTGGQEAVFLVGEKARIFELKLVLTPSGNLTPEVLKAEVYFE